MTMNKFYVSTGPHQILVLAHSDVHASIKALRKLFSREIPEEGTVLGFYVVVSQRGFDQHEDDTIFSTYKVVQLMWTLNQPINDNDDKEYE